MISLISDYFISSENRLYRRLEYTLQYAYALILKNHLLVALLQLSRGILQAVRRIGLYPPIIDLDPRSPIPITIIFNDVTIPPCIGRIRSFLSLVIKALGLPRNLALKHIK